MRPRVADPKRGGGAVRDLRELLAAFERVRAEGRYAALVTVVRVAGPAYRRPGARMLIAAGGARVGLVSGGCLEADLAERSRGALESGRALAVAYDASTDEELVFGLGSGCGGKIEVLIERVPERPDGGHLALASRCFARREPFALATVFGSDGAVRVGSRCWRTARGESGGDVDDAALAAELGRAAAAAIVDRRNRIVSVRTTEGAVEALVEALFPPPELLVLGAGSDALPVVRLAVRLGFDVTVADLRPALARPKRFPGAVRVVACDPGRLVETLAPDPESSVLVMSHVFAHDVGYLRELVPRHRGYLGVLGSRARTERVLAELAKEGVVLSAAQRARIRAPVGLDIGAETPEEIAVSALAEIRAVLSGRAGGTLSDRDAPIHGDGA